MLCIWSIALIYCYQCFSQTSLMQLAWNGAMLGEKQGHGLHHLYAGFMFFLTRFWILGALTALAAGVWHTLGCEFKYDCNSPLLAKNTLDFWRRYKNYSYDFLYRAVYLPSALSVSKHKSWQFSIGAGVTSVLLAVALVHVINPVPIPGFPFDHSYSWRGAIQHGFVMGIFILITQLFSHANNVILKYLRLEKTNWAVALSNLAQISFTCVTTSWYFYSAYAQMWRGWTIKEYFISILSF